MKQWLTWLVTSLALFTMVVSCGSATTPAPKPGPALATSPTARTQGQGASGTVASIDGSTLTLTTAQGPVTVNVGSNTSVQKTDTGALSDIQEGESLTVIGSRDANGNITATSIIIRPPRQGAPPGP